MKFPTPGPTQIRDSTNTETVDLLPGSGIDNFSVTEVTERRFRQVDSLW
jgi:hypothetical protein